MWDMYLHIQKSGCFPSYIKLLISITFLCNLSISKTMGIISECFPTLAFKIPMLLSFWVCLQQGTYRVRNFNTFSCLFYYLVTLLKTNTHFSLHSLFLFSPLPLIPVKFSFWSWNNSIKDFYSNGCYRDGESASSPVVSSNHKTFSLSENLKSHTGSQSAYTSS